MSLLKKVRTAGFVHPLEGYTTSQDQKERFFKPFGLSEWPLAHSHPFALVLMR